MATTAASTKQVNVTPNHLQEKIKLEVAYANGTGTLSMTQSGKLSDKGNISYEGGIRKGLRFNAEDGEAIDTALLLGSLVFTADGAPLAMSASGVHTSQPRVYPAGNPKAGQNMPGTGGNPTVCHTGYIDVADSRTDGGTLGYQVQVFVTYLGSEKGYNLKARAWVRPVNPGGPNVTGEVSGLTIS